MSKRWRSEPSRLCGSARSGASRWRAVPLLGVSWAHATIVMGRFQVTPSDYHRQVRDLEFQKLRCSIKGMRKGPLSGLWKRLHFVMCDRLQALIDQHWQLEREREREDVMRHVRQTVEYQRYGAFGVYGGGK